MIAIPKGADFKQYFPLFASVIIFSASFVDLFCLPFFSCCSINVRVINICLPIRKQFHQVYLSTPSLIYFLVGKITTTEIHNECFSDFQTVEYSCPTLSKNNCKEIYLYQKYKSR